MNSPLIWIGGKGNFVNSLLERMPEHDKYVEVFGGAASLLFAKPRTDFEVYNDINVGLSEFFRVVQHEERFKRLLRLTAVTFSSREIYRDYVSTYDNSDDIVERAHRFLTVSRQSFGGRFGKGWGWGIQQSPAHRWMKTINSLPKVYSRMRGVVVENQDWRTLIDQYDDSDTFFYMDPPYVASSRRSKAGYDHEMTDDDHKELIERIKAMKGKVMLSGYKSEIYEQLGWYCEDFETYCWVAGRTRNSKLRGEGGLQQHKQIECLWRNYQTQLSLF